MDWKAIGVEAAAMLLIVAYVACSFAGCVWFVSKGMEFGGLGGFGMSLNAVGPLFAGCFAVYMGSVLLRDWATRLWGHIRRRRP
jgi:hypothetical protein